jgi:hypothetical protein
MRPWRHAMGVSGDRRAVACGVIREAPGAWHRRKQAGPKVPPGPDAPRTEREGVRPPCGELLPEWGWAGGVFLSGTEQRFKRSDTRLAQLMGQDRRAGEPPSPSHRSSTQR